MGRKHPEWSYPHAHAPVDTDVGYMLDLYLPAVIQRLESLALAVEELVDLVKEEP